MRLLSNRFSTWCSDFVDVHSRVTEWTSDICVAHQTDVSSILKTSQILPVLVSPHPFQMTAQLFHFGWRGCCSCFPVSWCLGPLVWVEDDATSLGHPTGGRKLVLKNWVTAELTRYHKRISYKHSNKILYCCSQEQALVGWPPVTTTNRVIKFIDLRNVLTIPKSALGPAWKFWLCRLRTPLLSL